MIQPSLGLMLKTVERSVTSVTHVTMSKKSHKKSIYLQAVGVPTLQSPL